MKRSRRKKNQYNQNWQSGIKISIIYFEFNFRIEYYGCQGVKHRYIVFIQNWIFENNIMVANEKLKKEVDDFESHSSMSSGSTIC